MRVEALVRHLRRLLQRAAILKIRRDAGGTEAVIAKLGGDACRCRAPADHRFGEISPPVITTKPIDLNGPP